MSAVIERNEVPSDVFRAVLAISPEQREFIHRYLECSDEVQSVVRSMFAVLEHEQTTDGDRQRAFATIADALYSDTKSEKGHGRYGLDLAKVERESAKGHPIPDRRPVVTKRLDQLDAQEAAFSERLRQILTEKNITQEELAKRLDCTQSAISKMLSRNTRPRRKTIDKLATALNVAPTDLWPTLEIAAILDSVADFHEDQDLTEEQEKAIEAASKRPPVKVKTRDLPTRKRKGS